jgi:hypothetical protein
MPATRPRRPPVRRRRPGLLRRRLPVRVRHRVDRRSSFGVLALRHDGSGGIERGLSSRRAVASATCAVSRPGGSASVGRRRAMSNSAWAAAPTDRRQFLALCLLGATERGELLEGGREGPLGLRKRRLQIEVARRDRGDKCSSCRGKLGLRGGSLLRETSLVTPDGVDFRGEAPHAAAALTTACATSTASLRERSSTDRADNSCPSAAAAVSASSSSASAPSTSACARVRAPPVEATRAAASCQRACMDAIRAVASSSAVDSREACCSAWAASRRACGRSSPRMSSTRARLASDSTSCSSARRRRRSCRRTPATSSHHGRRSSGRSASAWSTMPWPMNRKALSARCAESSRSTSSRRRTRVLFRR